MGYYDSAVKRDYGYSGNLRVVYTWSDFMGPLLYINSVEKRTLSLGMTMFLSEHEVKWGALMAASAIFNFIIIIPYLCCQKQLVNSVKLSGFK